MSTSTPSITASPNYKGFKIGSVVEIEIIIVVSTGKYYEVLTINNINLLSGIGYSIVYMSCEKETFIQKQ